LISILYLHAPDLKLSPRNHLHIDALALRADHEGIFCHNGFVALIAVDHQWHLLDFQASTLSDASARDGIEGKPQGFRHYGAHPADAQQDTDYPRPCIGPGLVLHDLKEALGYSKLMHQFILP
jgi:hypothetical protein